MLLQLVASWRRAMVLLRPMPAAALQTWILNWRPPSVWGTGDLFTAKTFHCFWLAEHRAWLEALEQYL